MYIAADLASILISRCRSMQAMWPRFVAMVLLVAIAAAQRFNIVDFGAVADGKTENHASIQRAIQAAARAGGGNVFVPKGEFVSGAFNLSSHVFLEFDVGSVIRASADAKLYPCIPSVTSDTGRCDYPLIGAVGATNTGIVGFGTVNGGLFLFLFLFLHRCIAIRVHGVLSGANDPPGNFVDRYEASTNFLVPKEWPLPLCSFFSCRPKLVVFKVCILCARLVAFLVLIRSCSNALVLCCETLRSPTAPCGRCRLCNRAIFCWTASPFQVCACAYACKVCCIN